MLKQRGVAKDAALCIDNYEKIIGTQNFVFFFKRNVENHSAELFISARMVRRFLCLDCKSW
jgi:hypothetical protein